jgi:hypothetical protein
MATKRSPRVRQPIPVPQSTVLRKIDYLAKLAEIDGDNDAKGRILAMENQFRARIQTHALGLPAADAVFKKFNTNPFVLLIHAFKSKVSSVNELERDILPAKLFSSYETSAGRMVEEIVLPHYGWECVPSGMHTASSALDGRKLGSTPYEIATLKSGPRCLNDEMSADFAEAILNHSASWAASVNAHELDFTYGVLYGTPNVSNKKDWHILRILAEKCQNRQNCSVVTLPAGQWATRVKIENLSVSATVRIGLDWWEHLGGPNCLIEVLVAMIRACVAAPTTTQELLQPMAIRDLPLIISTAEVPDSFNVAILQRSQLPWLFLMLRHFCDDLV